MLVWVLTGVMTIIGALSYAELAAMMPHAGGQYVYLREAYSPLWGFLYGWTLFLVIQTGSIAAVAVAFAKFLGVLVPVLGTQEAAGAWILCRLPCGALTFTISAGQCVAVGIVVLLTLLNCLGVREGKWVQNIFTVAKTLALIAAHRPGLHRRRQPRSDRRQPRQPVARHHSDARAFKEAFRHLGLGAAGDLSWWSAAPWSARCSRPTPGTT